MIHIEVGMEVNMVHGIHCTDVMGTKATQAAVQRYIRIGLIDIKCKIIPLKIIPWKHFVDWQAHPNEKKNALKHNISYFTLFLVFLFSHCEIKSAYFWCSAMFFSYMNDVCLHSVAKFRFFISNLILHCWFFFSYSSRHICAPNQILEK